MADEDIAKVPTIYHDAVVRDMRRTIRMLAVFAAIEGAALVVLICFR